MNGELPVVSIGPSAFAQNSAIKRVYMPESVSVIYATAFSICLNLEYVSMPGVMVAAEDSSIGKNQFLGCTKLTTLIVPGGFNLSGQWFNSYHEKNYIPSIDIYVLSQAPINALPTSLNDMLSGNIYYYDETGTLCNTWRYAANGEIVLNKSHSYVSKNNSIECGKCGRYFEERYKYSYHDDTNSYWLDGLLDPTIEVVNVSSTFNDGIHGVLPVTAVNYNAFYQNSQITKVILPETVTEIYGSAFSGCSKLKTVIMPGVEKKEARHNSNQFINCTKLTTVVVGSSYNSIGQSFISTGDVTGITDFYVMSLGGGVSLSEKDSLFSGKIFYYDQRGIMCGSWMFNADGTDVIINTNNHDYSENKCTICGKVDGKGIVYNFEEDHYVVTGYDETLQEVVVVSDSYNDGVNGVAPVTAVQSNAFSGNATITKVILPESVTYIGSVAFAGCAKLTTVAMPGVTEIGNLDSTEQYLVFYQSTALRSVVVNENLKVGRKVFFTADSGEGTNIVDLYIYGTSNNVKFEYYNNAGLCTISGTQNSMLTGNAYFYSESGCFINTWKYDNDKNVVKTNVTAHNMVDGTCSRCGQMDAQGVNYVFVEDHYEIASYSGSAESVIIPEQYNDGLNGLKPVTAVQSNAFAGNGTITKVILPESVTYIGSSAFANCEKLTTVAMPGVTEIGNFNSTDQYLVFYQSKALRSVVVNENLKVGRKVFFTADSGEGTNIVDLYIYGTTNNVKFEYYNNAGLCTISGTQNSMLTGKFCYYSENTPADDGKIYWHYDSNGDVVLWS